MRPSTVGLIGLAALLAPTWSACQREPGVRVVLVTLDTLRQDAVTGVGERAPAMPRLWQRTQRSGLWFSRFYSATSVTQPSHASMLTELHPWQHGVTCNGRVLEASFETVPEALHAAGFSTHAVVASFPLESRFGFAQGFDSYHDEFTTAYREMHHWEQEEVPDREFFSLAHTITAEAIAAIDGAAGRKQFFWFHYFDPHAPYGASQGLDNNKWSALRRIDNGEPIDEVLADVRRQYEIDVAYLDQHLDALLARLDQDRDEFETHIVLAADHGESLGEGGTIGHGDRLTDAEILVPGIVLTDRVPPGVRSEPAGSIDIAPTLLSLAGLPTWQRGGRDLTLPAPAVTEAVGMRRTFRTTSFRERRIDGMHELPDLWFYTVTGDGPTHRGNGRGIEGGATDAAVLARFEAFEAAIAELAVEGALDPQVEDALRALGYTGR